MAFVPEDLGISQTGLPLLRDLIHERMGLIYDNGRADLLTDRLAPLVVACVQRLRIRVASWPVIPVMLLLWVAPLACVAVFKVFSASMTLIWSSSSSLKLMNFCS